MERKRKAKRPIRRLDLINSLPHRAQIEIAVMTGSTNITVCRVLNGKMGQTRGKGRLIIQKAEELVKKHRLNAALNEAWGHMKA
jgi:hypothetical protein